jgi:uncharacterized protein (DUF924 family)
MQHTKTTRHPLPAPRRGMLDIMRPEAVLEYWFAGVSDDPSTLPGRMRLWFGSEQDSPAEAASRDAALAERFRPYMAARLDGQLDDWAESASGRLALILLTDQFPRSIHRGRPEAFALDAEALSLCTAGLDLGQDRELGPFERAFFYLPLEHSESLEDQERCVSLFAELERDVPAELHATFAGFTRYAILHRDIVARFGRFPHRNGALGRPNSPEEAEYLAGDAPRFGQD